MVKRELIASRDIRFPAIPNNEDALFSASVMAYAKTVFILPKKLVVYRWGTGSSIQDHESQTPEGALIASEIVFEQLQNSVANSAERDSLFECCFLLALMTLKVATTHKNYTNELHSRIITDLKLWNARDRKNALRHKPFLYYPLALLMNSDYETVSWVYAKHNQRRETSSSIFEKASLGWRMLFGLTYSLRHHSN